MKIYTYIYKYKTIRVISVIDILCNRTCLIHIALTVGKYFRNRDEVEQKIKKD